MTNWAMPRVITRIYIYTHTPSDKGIPEENSKLLALTDDIS
jgi:hypothetical protein